MNFKVAATTGYDAREPFGYQIGQRGELTRKNARHAAAVLLDKVLSSPCRPAALVIAGYLPGQVLGDPEAMEYVQEFTAALETISLGIDDQVRGAVAARLMVEVTALTTELCLATDHAHPTVQ